MHLLRQRWPVALLAAVLMVVIALTLTPYRGDVSALFHMDAEHAQTYQPPAGFVLLDMPGYDGMQYYAIARTVPDLLTGEGRARIGADANLSYSYQRFLLPLLAFALSLGNDTLLPFAFIALNVGSLLAACWWIVRWRRSAWPFALGIALSPAAMVGLHFSLAEPLTLLLFTVVLTRVIDRDRIDVLDALLLAAAALSREINGVAIAFLLAAFLVRGRWRDALWLCLPATVFLLWHAAIYGVFGTVPFLWSAGKRDLPFAAIVEILLGRRGFNAFTLSSIALFLGFCLPAIVLLLRDVARRRPPLLLGIGALAFLAVMSVMRFDIWGAITSIGRVITPVYPFVLLYGACQSTRAWKLLAVATMAVGLAAGMGLALTVHPWHAMA
ncbi:MAG: hypothetical protein G01um101425_107 [Candidatus Peregrinibacteria bacterium Gr01-1014_25]|nr:MAG: hypothetical protein G01um101425_107 [Candidatus Peregrinibacteria bacterium Gr01-1014_25]